MHIDPKIKQLNETNLRSITSDDPYLNKEAANGISDFLRMKAREDGISRSVLPPVKVTADDLDRQAETVKPVIVKDKEPDTPGGYSVPFGSVPMSTYVGAPRYRVMFEILETKRFTGNVYNLLTYDMDIRQIYNDQMLNDLLEEEDTKFIGVVDQLCGTLDATTGTHVDETDAVGYASVGAMDRQALNDAAKSLPSTNKRLSVDKALMNVVTTYDIAGLVREEIGGDLAQEMLTQAFNQTKIAGMDVYTTIKSDLVADDVMYMFAEPKYLGDFFLLEDVTVSTEKQNYYFEMFAYEVMGAHIGNLAAVSKAYFGGSFDTWRVSSDASSS